MGTQHGVTANRGKQRRARERASLHTRQRFMHVHCSPELRKRYGKRSVGIRVGDEVKVMRGRFRGKHVKVDSVNLKKIKLYLTKIEVPKKDGTKTTVPFDPSNLMLTGIGSDDKRRKLRVQKRGPAAAAKTATATATTARATATTATPAAKSAPKEAKEAKPANTYAQSNKETGAA